MALPTDIHPFVQFAGGATADLGDPIDQSLRFTGSQKLESSYFGSSNTFGSNWSISFWVKFAGPINTTRQIIAVGERTAGGNYTILALNDSVQGQLSADSGATSFTFNGRKFRDPSAWYHILMTNSEFYINGEAQSATSGYWSNFDGCDKFGFSNWGGTPNSKAEMYLAEFHLLQTTLTPTDFGRNNDDGVWVPISTSFTAAQYGANGAHLTLDSSQTNAGIAEDSAPIGASGHTARNDYTATGFDTGDVASYAGTIFTDHVNTGASATPNISSTASTFTNDFTNAFDGNTTTRIYTSGAGSWIIFRPSTAIPMSTGLRIWAEGAYVNQVWLNGSNSSFTSTGTTTWQTIPIGSETQITSIAIQGTPSPASGATLFAIEVDGTILQHNTDNDVDYNDTPTNNYGVLNPLNVFDASVTYSKANLRANYGGLGNRVVFVDMPMADGKYYWELTLKDQVEGWAGVITEDYVKRQLTAFADNSDSWAYELSGSTDNQKRHNDINSSSHGALVADDTIGFLLDIASGTLEIEINGTTQSNSEFTNIPTSKRLFVAFNIGGGSGNVNMDWNFGQMPFVHSQTGYNDLATNNLPEPTIKNGKEHFGVLTYTAPASPSYPITIDGSGGNNGTGELDFDGQPDLVWIKMRNGSQNHILFDTVRGATKSLRPDGLTAESTRSNFAFATNGFTFSAADAESYQANDSYVAWCWKTGGTASVTYTVKVVSDSGNKYRFDDFGTSAVTLDLEEGGTYVFDQSDSSNSGHPLRFSTTSDGTHGGGSEYTTGVTTTGTPGSAGAKTTITVASGAATLHYYCSVHSGMGGQANTNDTKGSSNFAGTIQSKLTANTDAGFSIISYTGNGTLGATIGHGLTQAPEFFIVKRTETGNSQWYVYHASIGNQTALNLNSNGAKAANSTGYWNSTSPTNQVISLGNFADTNGNTNPLICYAWHSVEGFSKFGSFEGNSSTDGPFIYTGFRPAFVMVKNTGSTSTNWCIQDSTRFPSNPANGNLQANEPDADSGTRGDIDILSNGFKARASGTDGNGSTTMVYMALAESPFGGENVPPATAR